MINTTASKQSVVRVNLPGMMPIFCKAYYIQSINLNPLPCSRLDEQGVNTIFESGKCKVFDRYDRNDILGLLSRTRSERRFAGQIMVPSHKQGSRSTLKIAAVHKTKRNAYSITDQLWLK